MANTRDETPCYVYHCKDCGGLNGASVADLNDTVCMKSALQFKRDAEKRGNKVSVLAVSDVRTARWCFGKCRTTKAAPLLALEEA